jgi:hypothetical protein
MRMRGPPPIIAVLATSPLLLTLGCTEGTGRAGVVEREVRGDTTVIRTLSGGEAWPDGSARLDEELSIGVLDGPEELMLAQVAWIAPDGGGGVYVFDGVVPALRHYDGEGNFVQSFGGRGQGPGEFQDAALGLHLRSDGRLQLRDARNGRMILYAPDGTPDEHWPVVTSLFTSRAMVVDTAGYTYLKILTGEVQRDRPWPIGLLRLDPHGAVVDTLHPPPHPDEPTEVGGTFLPALHWEFSPLGYFVSGVSTNYAVALHKPDGIVRLEREWTPVPVHPEERAEREARNRWSQENLGGTLTAEFPPVPRSKPAYRGIFVGTDGSIWVHRHESAEEPDPAAAGSQPDPEGPPPLRWIEPSTFDVFREDGEYLGVVDVPRGMSLRVFSLEELWGVRAGELGEPQVVRLRLRVG